MNLRIFDDLDALSRAAARTNAASSAASSVRAA